MLFGAMVGRTRDVAASRPGVNGAMVADEKYVYCRVFSQSIEKFS